MARKPIVNMRMPVNLKSVKLDTALRQYRTEQAYIRAVPHAAVFSDALLRRIVASKPCTLEALSKLNGIGQTRSKHYGRDIVRLVNLQLRKGRALPQRHHSTTTARGAKRTKRNALKGKPQTKSIKPSTTISKSSCKSMIIPAAVQDPLNLTKALLDSTGLTHSPEASGGKIVLSRFFPLPENVKPELKPLKKVKAPKASVYILELEDGRVYVGSSIDVKRRLQQHCSGSGSAYTRVYKPTGVLLPRLGNVEGDGDAAERDETLRYMMLRGVPFVRGWKFARVDMPPEEYEEAESNIRELFDLCRRCGYKGHFCTHCKATFDRLGNPVHR
jgi:predicted GIY-YIG superfamily endonuclease